MAGRPRRAAAPDIDQLLDRHIEPVNDDVAPDSKSEIEDVVEMDPGVQSNWEDDD